MVKIVNGEIVQDVEAGAGPGRSHGANVHTIGSVPPPAAAVPGARPSNAPPPITDGPLYKREIQIGDHNVRMAYIGGAALLVTVLWDPYFVFVGVLVAMIYHFYTRYPGQGGGPGGGQFLGSGSGTSSGNGGGGGGGPGSNVRGISDYPRAQSS